MTTVFVRTQFEALHYWRGAPEDVAFLRDPHRHLFQVRVTLNVTHNDRDIEFFQFKRKLDAFIAKHYAGKTFPKSCEMIAEEILVHFRAESVEVSEDGENGAVVTKSTKSSKSIGQIFTGVEVEGPEAGTEVLFVPASMVSEAVGLVANAQSKAPRIYFGAGNSYKLVYMSKVNRLLSALKEYKFTGALDIETNNSYVLHGLACVKPSFRSLLGWLIYRGRPDVKKLPRWLCDKLMIKTVVRETIRWRHVASGKDYETWLHHPEFDRDRTVIRAD